MISPNQPSSMAAAAGVTFVPIPGPGSETGLIRRDSPSLSSSSGSPPTAGVLLYQPAVQSGSPYYQTAAGSEGAASVVYYIQTTAATSMPTSSMPSQIYHATPFHAETVQPAAMAATPVWSAPSAACTLGDHSTVSAYAVGPLTAGAASTVQAAMAEEHAVTAAAASTSTAAVAAAGPIYVAQQPMTYQFVPHQYSQPLHPASMSLQMFMATENPLINSTNMEVVWHSSFDSLFGSFGHSWNLEPAPVNDRDEPTSVGQQQSGRLLAGKQGVREYKDSAKVRFHCKRCGKAWTSMKGRVIFWYQLCQSNDAAAAAGGRGVAPGYVGTVQFRLFGQRCEKCKIDDYENAMWYPEEVRKVVWNIWNRVGQTYYGFERKSADGARRTGRPRSQHNSSLCQACHEGICNENRDDRSIHIAAAAAAATAATTTTSSSSGTSNVTSLANRLQQQLTIGIPVAAAAGSGKQPKPQNPYHLPGGYWSNAVGGFVEPLPMVAGCYGGPAGDCVARFVPQPIMSC